VNFEESISQGDIAVKYLDTKGKVLMDTPILLQNIVKSTRQPIEKGKTCQVKDTAFLRRRRWKPSLFESILRTAPNGALRHNPFSRAFSF
jgi:hypothetical protein